MNLLIIGGAGHVGTILRPALEAQHQCRYLDLHAIPDAGERSIAGDLHDVEVLDKALDGIDCILWTAMGLRPGEGKESCGDTKAAFDVNVHGLYLVLQEAARRGIKRFVYTSSLSVYTTLHDRKRQPITEGYPPEAWHVYGLTKRLGEIVGETWAAHHPGSVFVGLRIVMPRREDDWEDNSYVAGKSWSSLGPRDLRSLFLAALACATPGAHLVQASGDVAGAACDHTHIYKVLGWMPRGE